ncbi:hypothetical protein C8R43DRAFT_1129417 [Mycena crocata]|nr:hypothetical protein C8R43DRAFT_1129417 [Mycena crocata]
MCCDSLKPLLSPVPSFAQSEELRDLPTSLHPSLDFPRVRYQSKNLSPMVTLAQDNIERERMQGTPAERSKMEDCFVPIHRLPPELLCEIFIPFSQPTPETHNQTPDGERASIAKRKLLQLSSVCSHWHILIMGTPSLWSHVSVTTQLWPGISADGGASGSVFDALKTALRRAGQHPLAISVACRGSPASIRRSVLALLGEHERRWQHLELDVQCLSDLQDISLMEGELDALETLTLVGDRQIVSADIWTFETAPRLTRVAFDGPPGECPRLPWRQLRSFTYSGHTYSSDVTDVLALMRNISHPDAAFEIRNWHGVQWNTSLRQLAFTCPITSLLVEATTTGVMGGLLAGLTLPQLRELHFPSNQKPRVIKIPWRSIALEFAALALRSSFRNTLRILDIGQVIITAEELMICLASLLMLERLIVSDQKIWSMGDHVLVTDALLLQLTLTPDSFAPLPHLRYFDCTSCFRFDAKIYLDFVTSRVALGGKPFHSILRPFQGRKYKLDTEVHQKLLDLVTKGGLRFDVGDDLVNT